MQFYGSIAGVFLAILLNLPADTGSSWWYGIAFAVAQVLFTLGLIRVSLLLAIGWSGGLVVGGTIAIVVVIVQTEWSYLPGAILTLILANFSYAVVGNVRQRMFGRNG